MAKARADFRDREESFQETRQCASCNRETRQLVWVLRTTVERKCMDCGKESSNKREPRARAAIAPPNPWAGQERAARAGLAAAKRRADRKRREFGT
jgi:hypothetical protein